MKSLTMDHEEKKLREVANDYTSRGYEVTLHPSKDGVPNFLRNFQIDLIARKPGDSVVVEVISAASRKMRSESIRSIAESVDANAGWRFDLVVTNPRTKILNEPQELRKGEILQLIEEADALRRKKHIEASIALLWSAFEAAGRKALSHDSGTSDPKPLRSPLLLAKLLYSKGIIDRQEYFMIRTTIKLRNSVVHGFRLPRKSVNTKFDRLREIAEMLAQHDTTSLEFDADHDNYVKSIRQALNRMKRLKNQSLKLTCISKSSYDANNPAHVLLTSGASASCHAVKAIVVQKGRPGSVFVKKHPENKRELEELSTRVWNSWLESTS